MSRNTKLMTRAAAALIIASGAQNAEAMRASDLRAASTLAVYGGDQTPTEIGRRKVADGKIVSLTGMEPGKRVRFKDSPDRPVGVLRQRFTPANSTIALLPKPIGDSWARYLAVSHPRANPAQARAAEAEFVTALANDARRVHALRMAGSRISDLSPQDQAIYFFGSALAAIHRVIKIRLATPTILGVCNITDYGTDALAWSDTLENFRATLPNRSAWSSGGPGTATHPDASMLTGRFQRSGQKWNKDEQEIARHVEAMAQDGGPAWDLLDRTIIDSTAVVETDVARLVAFGSNPGIAPPNGTSIPGMLYLKVPEPVDISNVSGEVNFATLRDWMIAQQTATSYSGGLAADVLVLAPQDYMRLASQYINSAGSDESVIDALLKKLPFLREIRMAREFEPLAAEEANLVAAGVPAAVAKMLSGGVNVNGVQKRAIAFFRDDPEVITIKRGREPYTNDGGLVGGVYCGEVAANTGGTYLYQSGGMRLGYAS